MRVPQLVRGILWVQLYLLVSIAPLLFAVIGGPPGRGFLMDLSVALGFVGLSMLGLQFVLTARFDVAEAPYGMDVVLQFHRQISLVAFGFILAHPTLVFVSNPELLRLLNPATATWPARFGLLSLIGLLAIIVTSVWRQPLGIRYETWRIAHGVLAVVIVAAALVHIGLVGYYVSGPWKIALWIAMSAALIGVTFYVRLVKPVLLYNKPWEITDVSRERGDAWTLGLRPVDHEGIAFEPGQYAWLIVHTTPFSVREHPFSLSSSAERADTVEMTIKELGDFTATVGDIEPGTRAYLDGPYGVFTPDRNEGSGYVLIAGGIGITPVISILRTFADRGDVRPVVLIYANPDWEGLTFREEIAALEERLNLHVVYVLEEPPDGWEGPSGFVTPELLNEHLPPHGRRRLQYFICGPDPMLDAVEQALADEGVPLERIQVERFDLI